MTVPFVRRIRFGVIDEFVRVASVDEIPNGTAKSFTVGQYEVAIFHVGDEWYALEGTCPHQGGPLAEGWIDGSIVTCPWHAWCFDVRDGKMTLGDYASVETFEVVVEDAVVSISPEPRT